MLVAAPTEEIAMTVRIHDQIHEIDLHPKTPKQPHFIPSCTLPFNSTDVGV